MSRWDPHIDLMRLLEALGNEVVAMTELEVRQACAAEDGHSMAGTSKVMWSGWPALEVEGDLSMARTAKEIRELIDAVNGDPGEPEVDADQGHIELRRAHHLQSASEPGSRTCYKQH